KVTDDTTHDRHNCAGQKGVLHEAIGEHVLQVLDDIPGWTGQVCVHAVLCSNHKTMAIFGHVDVDRRVVQSTQHVRPHDLINGSGYDSSIQNEHDAVEHLQHGIEIVRHQQHGDVTFTPNVVD